MSLHLGYAKYQRFGWVRQVQHSQDFAYLLGLSRGRTETKRAVEAERARIIALLNGIDKDEISHPDGWWETSTGADFGASILQKIRNGNQALTTSPLDESTQDFDALASGPQ